MKDAELEDLAIEAFREAQHEEQRDSDRAEYERLNAAAIRFYEMGYCYPPPGEHADAATIEDARRLLDELDALAAQVRGTPGGKGAENVARVADEHARAFYRVMRDRLIPDDLIERARDVLDSIEATTGFAVTRRA
jgi:hypothetical protein